MLGLFFSFVGHGLLAMFACLLISSRFKHDLRQIRLVLTLANQTLKKYFAYGLPDYAKLSGVPVPNPYPFFDIDKTKARPYRPFRWPYHQNMSLKKLEPDWWIELESTYRERIAQRIDLYKEHGEKIINSLPGSEAAMKELMEMVIQFLCARYPNQFYYNEWTGMFHNHILASRSDTRKIRPLVFLLQNVPEDFLIVQKDEKTGLSVLTAGVSCSAVGWNLSLKIGQPLHQIHGPVPFYKEKMSFSMDRYFSNMPCDKPIQRGSWGLEIGEPLYLQAEDPDFAMRTQQDPQLKVSDISLRVDWQTLRRMPRSQAIVFNFKALFTPLTHFRREPFVPKLLLKVLSEGQKSIMEYKGTWHVEHVVLPALKLWADEQEEHKWVPRDWQVRTLDEDPFYPGWGYNRDYDDDS